MNLPIIDTHCDLLCYLAHAPGADPDHSAEIPCSLPLLQQGGVKLQCCAIYTGATPGSAASALRQAEVYRDLLVTHSDRVCQADARFLAGIEAEARIGLVAALESATGLVEADGPIADALTRLDELIALTGRIAYISLTHHTENRFGGGNFSEGVGLTDDGRRLLDHVAGRRIAIDLSHTSDLLAEGILQHIDRGALDIPVIATHSNFRAVWNHVRNLTDEFAKEIIHRKGLIGINFVRAFIDDDQPERIFEHIRYGFALGAGDQLCFGADFFDVRGIADPARHPIYHANAADPTAYPALLEAMADTLSREQLEKLAWRNAQRFYLAQWQ